MQISVGKVLQELQDKIRESYPKGTKVKITGVEVVIQKPDSTAFKTILVAVRDRRKSK